MNSNDRNEEDLDENPLDCPRVRWPVVLAQCNGRAQTTAPAPSIELKRDDRQGQLQVLIDGREAVAYQYGPDLDFPHYYPVRSPSGKPLTVQYPDDRFSHHRSIWINDIVQPPNHEPISFYAIGLKEDSKRTAKGFRDCIRHVKFLGEDVAGGKATIRTLATWLADFGKLRRPRRTAPLRVVPLGRGEYLLDLQFEVRASYGDMRIVSEWNHYAWPYVRMHSKFDVKTGGGTITNSAGGVNEQGTHEKRALWVDCSNRVDGVTEGLARLPGRRSRVAAAVAGARLRHLRPPPTGRPERRALRAQEGRVAQAARGHPRPLRRRYDRPRGRALPAVHRRQARFDAR